METKPIEWLFKLESSISEEIRLPAIFAQLRLSLLIWLVSSCNGMDQTV